MQRITYDFITVRRTTLFRVHIISASNYKWFFKMFPWNLHAHLQMPRSPHRRQAAAQDVCTLSSMSTTLHLGCSPYFSHIWLAHYWAPAMCQTLCYERLAMLRVKVSALTIAATPLSLRTCISHENTYVITQKTGFLIQDRLLWSICL